MNVNKLICRIMYIFILLLVLSNVHAINICTSNFITDEDIPCLIVTPVIFCDNYTYTLFYNNSFLETKNLNSYYNNSYYFEFNNSYEKGDYYIVLCDYTTRQFKYGDNMINFGSNTINILLILFFLLLNIFLGIYWSRIFLVIAGIIFVISAFILYNTIISLIFYISLFLGILFILIGVLLFIKEK